MGKLQGILILALALSGCKRGDEEKQKPGAVSRPPSISREATPAATTGAGAPSELTSPQAGVPQGGNEQQELPSVKPAAPGEPRLMDRPAPSDVEVPDVPPPSAPPSGAESQPQQDEPSQPGAAAGRPVPGGPTVTLE